MVKYNEPKYSGTCLCTIHRTTYHRVWSETRFLGHARIDLLKYYGEGGGEVGGGGNSKKPVSRGKQNSSGHLEILPGIRRLGNFSGKYDIVLGYYRKNREDVPTFPRENLKLHTVLLRVVTPRYYCLQTYFTFLWIWSGLVIVCYHTWPIWNKKPHNRMVANNWNRKKSNSKPQHVLIIHCVLPK